MPQLGAWTNQVHQSGQLSGPQAVRPVTVNDLPAVTGKEPRITRVTSLEYIVIYQCRVAVSTSLEDIRCIAIRSSTN